MLGQGWVGAEAAECRCSAEGGQIFGDIYGGK